MATEETIQQINATVEAVIKRKASTEGMLFAYASLVVMALVPIFYGSFLSVGFRKKQAKAGEKVETISRKEAAMFPVYASCALFGLYIFFKLFSKENINLLLSAYFCILGTFSLANVFANVFDFILKKTAPNLHSKVKKYDLLFTQDGAEMLHLEFDTTYIAAFVSCTAIGAWYVLTKHWIANNLFGFAFSITAIEYINLSNIGNGCILLGGLFIYDIFWVFGTDVMVTVAKSFDAPIKLVFPQDFLESGVNGTQFAMLGLGDIVVPGIFIALLLRFDVSLGRKSNVYFCTSFIAYILGLLLTMVVMMYFKHAQPALLYLVPCCILFPFLVAAIKGDVKAMLKYDEDEEAAAEAEESSKDK